MGLGALAAELVTPRVRLIQRPNEYHALGHTEAQVSDTVRKTMVVVPMVAGMKG